MHSEPGPSRAAPVMFGWFVAFAASQTLFALNHELTLDEAQAWNIARLAAWPLDVVGIARLEGHTPLWHLVLWPFARSADPDWMRVPGVVAALLFAGAWLRHAPFSPLVRVVVLFGYFTAFRYPTLVRSYVLLLPLLAWLALSVRARSPHLLRRCTLCGLIAMNGAFGVLLSLPLVAIVAMQAPSAARAERLRLIAGLGGYALLTIAAIAFVVLPVQGAPFVGEVLAGEMNGDYPVFEPIVQAAFPHATDLPLGLGHGFDRPSGRLLSGVASLMVGAAIGVLLLPWRAGAIAWLGGVALVWGASAYAGLVEERYSGHLVLLALTLLWMRPAFLGATRLAASAPEASSTRLVASIILAPVLLWHVAMTVGVGGIDVIRTTSNAEETITLLEESRIDAVTPPVIITGQVYDAAAVVALLDRPVFDTDCRCLTRYRADSALGPTLPSPARIESDWCALVSAGHDVVGLFPDGRHRPDARHEILGTIGPGTRHPAPAPLYRLHDPLATCTPDDVPGVDVHPETGSVHGRTP